MEAVPKVEVLEQPQIMKNLCYTDTFYPVILIQFFKFLWIFCRNHLFLTKAGKNAGAVYTLAETEITKILQTSQVGNSLAAYEKTLNDAISR
jgi:hypothetical protein